MPLLAYQPALRVVEFLFEVFLELAIAVLHRHREGMKDQLGALGLVVNVMVLWTTLYMDRALSQLQDLGATINDEDVARLSPLGTNHINVLGRYHFALPDAIARR